MLLQHGADFLTS